MFEKFLLQRVQVVAVGHALDGIDGTAFGFDAHYKARTDKTSVQHHAARPAIARRATFLAARQLHFIAQDVQKGLTRLAQKFNGFTVDRRRHVVFRHRSFLQRFCFSRALWRAQGR